MANNLPTLSEKIVVCPDWYGFDGGDTLSIAREYARRRAKEMGCGLLSVLLIEKGVRENFAAFKYQIRYMGSKT